MVRVKRERRYSLQAAEKLYVRGKYHAVENARILSVVSVKFVRDDSIRDRKNPFLSRG